MDILYSDSLDNGGLKGSADLFLFSLGAIPISRLPCRSAASL